MKGKRGVFSCLLLLTLAAASVWPQELSQDELITAAGRTYAFSTFQGRESVAQSAQEIVGIGEVLWRTLKADGKRGDYFGKYEVIRALDPAPKGRLGADIIVFDAGARVNTLDNVQRVVAGYLAAAFGLRQADAARMAVLVTKYNAAHRGDLAYLAGRYVPEVMSNLTAENAGIALSYKEWPGKTRLIIPLSYAAGGQVGVAVTPRPATQPRAALTPGSAAPQPGVTLRSAAAPASGQAGAAPPEGTGGRERVGVAEGSGAEGGASNAATGGTSGGSATSTENRGAVPAETDNAAPEASGAGANQRVAPPGSPAGGSVGGFLSSGNVRWLLFLLIAAALVLAFVATRFFRASLSRAWARAALRSAREGHPLIEMIVTMQNRHIGMRNAHYVPPGSSAVVGGGRSAFLIYFVPVPHRIAVLAYDGERYTFVPIKKEFFPSLPSEMPDCLGKPIPAQSARGYKFTILFRTFVAPLEEINRLMRSVRVHP